MTGVLVKMNRFVMWANIVEFDNGVRLRLMLNRSS